MPIGREQPAGSHYNKIHPKPGLLDSYDITISSLELYEI
jgi:hypothetical protein